MADSTHEICPEPLADEPGPGRPDCLRFYRNLAVAVTVVAAVPISADVLGWVVCLLEDERRRHLDRAAAPAAISSHGAVLS